MEDTLIRIDCVLFHTAGFSINWLEHEPPFLRATPCLRDSPIDAMVVRWIAGSHSTTDYLHRLESASNTSPRIETVIGHFLKRVVVVCL